VTSLSEYNDIFGKMTQFYNNNANANSQMKTVKSRHPVAAFGGRECSTTLFNGFHYRPRRFGRIHSEGVIICYACGKDGHIARHCLEKRKEDQEVVCFACGLMGHRARKCHLTQKKDEPSWFA